MVWGLIDGLGQLRTRVETALPSAEQKAAAAAKVERERLSRETEERDARTRAYNKELFGLQDESRANQAFRTYQLEQEGEDRQLNRSTQLMGSAAGNKIRITDATTDANIRRDRNQQEFFERSLGQLGDQEIRVIDRFIGQTPLADNYFGLEREKLALAKQAYADSMKPLTFWENIGRMAPALTTAALALFG
jgi:hypothetical protein